MTEEGTLSIVRHGNSYQVRYASNHPYGMDRQLCECPDEETLGALLQQLGTESGSIDQACAELRKGAVAVLLIVLSAAQMQTWFPPQHETLREAGRIQTPPSPPSSRQERAHQGQVKSLQKAHREPSPPAGEGTGPCLHTLLGFP